jgi:hypothetical protein
MPGNVPTAAQDAQQRGFFPGLSCFSVTADPSGTYNCFSLTVSVTDRFLGGDEVDGYGNRNGIVEVSDFDAFYKFAGYSPSPNCSIEDGKHKIALFGFKDDASGKLSHGHAARQEGPVFESKEGSGKQVIHALKALEGPTYGLLVKCYERPLP